MVTRETQTEKCYGLGRSLTPLAEELRHRGFMVDYICQSDLGPRSVRWQQRLNRLFSILPNNSKTDTDFPILFSALLERLNMGRVAAKLAAQQGFTHVHCHDPVIAAGFRLFARLYPDCRAVWGVTEHGFGCYTNAMRDDGIRLGNHIIRIIRAWEARTLLAADWVIAPTHSGITQIANDLNISPIPEHWQHV
ncbi:MAG: glycosyltransferase, partial [Betaproteobacteria bacterium]|nr:glycosyltransferase [Betaproteobacteria bacterium]